MRLKLFFIIIVAVILLPLCAQVKLRAETKKPVKKVEKPKARPDSIVITGFINKSNKDSTDRHIYRGGYIQLFVNDLNVLVKRSKKDPKNELKIILFVDGIPFNDVTPTFVDTVRKNLIFHFSRPDEDEVAPDTEKKEDAAWVYFYKKPRLWDSKKRIISIGLQGEDAIPSKTRIELVVVKDGMLKFVCAFIVALIGLVFWLAITTSLLRDSGELKGSQRPYSLARTQLAFWLVLISCSFLFLWVSTGEMPELTNSTLILLGISGVTSIAAKAIDNTRSLIVPTDVRNELFIIDILSDEKGMSIHRLQMFIFTVIFGTIFVHDVISVFEMPEFSDNLLLLMGISSGAYAGLKLTENNPSTPVG